MALLKDLPNELWCKIFSYLGYDALLRISLLSRRLHATATPFLYHSLSPTSSTLCKLLRTILSRPMLANYVRSVSLDWAKPTTSPFPTVDPILQTSADNLGLQYSLHLEGAQLGLLLHVLPRLECLDIESLDSDIFDDFLARYAFQPTTTFPIGLQSLRKINWNRRSCDCALLTIMRLPSIHTVKLWALEEWDTADFHQFEGTSTVKNLTFCDGDAYAPSVACILKMPKTLERFTFGRNFLGTSLALNAPEVGKLLGMHRDTMQSINLCFAKSDVDFWGDDFPEDGVIGSLRDWPVLVEVRCSLRVLLGKKPEAAVARLVDVLPAAIQELEIYNDCFWTVGQIADEVEHMLEMREAYGLHSLKEVRVLHYKELKDRLKAPCEAAGVFLAGTRYPGM